MKELEFEPNPAMPPLQKTLFKPGFEAYPTPEVLEGEENLDEDYERVSVELFGEIEDSKSMKDLVVEFKEAVQKEGLVVPGESPKTQENIVVWWVDFDTLRITNHDHSLKITTTFTGSFCAPVD